MTERTVAFGPDDRLSGILTLSPQERAPFVVLLSNTGMHHRVGPYRLNVELAQALAHAGIPVFRYDRSGMGDSEARTTPGSDHEHALLDAHDAMAAVTAAVGITRFVLVALCSGVDIYHEIARDDVRVVGYVPIDGHAYPTAGFVRRRRQRFLDVARYRRWLGRLRHRQQHAAFFGTDSHAAAVFARAALPLAQWRADLLGMAARGAHVLAVNTGGADSQWNAADQLLESLAPTEQAAQFGAIHMPQADHLFAAPAQRAQLATHLVSWAQRVAAAQGESTMVDTLNGGSDTVTRLLLTA